jgi:carbon-monoxide dehydrogenase small subunit
VTTFTLNGAPRRFENPPATRLLDALREAGFTGTKEGCGEGECGSCTVLLDGAPVNACLVLLGQCEARKVVTVEGLAPKSGGLHPLQDAFVNEGGTQCGICTPGMLVAAYALLADEKDPSDERIREALAGNICRCTGYERIVASVRSALKGVAVEVTK